MARVTVEDCLTYVPNRYELVHLCTKRTRQLFRGAERLVQRGLRRRRIIAIAHGGSRIAANDLDRHASIGPAFAVIRLNASSPKVGVRPSRDQ